MNRGRGNRQPRQNRQQHGPSGGRQQRAPREYSANVPTIQSVTPGASVSIVLKQDQPTGREVQGVVQDLLTRGNHPRGIKVRLTDGRVGRVQRMANDQAPAQQPPAGFTVRREGRTAPTYQDIRNEEEFPSMPPPRTLLDFLPESHPSSESPDNPGGEPITFSSATAKCPICGDFEGDEIAVTRHVEGHLT
ncbi:hypothetical protein Q7P37_007174 [Cladosporium fusiforme]